MFMFKYLYTTGMNGKGMIEKNGNRIKGKWEKPVFQKISLTLSNNALDSFSDM